MRIGSDRGRKGWPGENGGGSNKSLAYQTNVVSTGDKNE